MRWGEVCMGLDGWWQPTSWRYAHLNVLHTHTHTPSALSSCCCNIYVPIYPLTHKCQRFSFSVQDPTSPLDALSFREPSQPACSGLLCVVFHVFIICSTCSFLPHSAARCSRLPLLQHPLLCRYCAPPLTLSFYCSYSFIFFVPSPLSAWGSSSDIIIATVSMVSGEGGCNNWIKQRLGAVGSLFHAKMNKNEKYSLEVKATTLYYRIGMWIVCLSKRAGLRQR